MNLRPHTQLPHYPPLAQKLNLRNTTQRTHPVNSRLSEAALLCTPSTLTRVACDSSCWLTSSGVSLGRCSSSMAAAPATCGAACDVPLSWRVEVAPSMPADTIDSPGAHMSTQLPKLEKDERRSPRPTEPTVMAVLTAPGDISHASGPSHPSITV
jgi:hypothetical protein